jgi:hypothetical protein
MLLVGIFVAVAIGLYRTVIAGKLPYIRRFPALEAMEEGIGIAVETGKMTHFGSPGGIGTGTGEGGTASVLQTVAIMGHYAGKAAAAGVSTVYSVSTAPVLTLAEGVVREAYVQAGKLADFENPDMCQIRFVAGGEGTYPSFYAGLMQRNMGASIINAGGKFKLFMGEANQQAGVFGICLSPSYDKLEWGIATFDYVLMLSETFVAQASITKDPFHLGSAIGSDIVTWICAALFVVFVGLATALGTDLGHILTG